MKKCRADFIPHDMWGVWNEFHTTCCRPHVADLIFSQPLSHVVGLAHRQGSAENFSLKVEMEAMLVDLWEQG